MKRLLVVVAAVAVTGVACSGNNNGEISASAERVLAPAVQHVREVAYGGDYLQLQAAVAELKTLVRQEERTGGVTGARAAAILDAADALLQDASPSPSPSPSSTSPSPTPTSTSPSPTPTSTSPSPTPTATSTSPTPTPSATSTSPSPILSLSAAP